MFRITQVCFVSLVVSLGAFAQTSSNVSSDEALDKALQNNVLTFNGVPFHALLEIDSEEAHDLAFHASVEVFWQSDENYRLIVESRDFAQTLIKNHGQESETDRGDYYPGWLRGFVTALMDPMPRVKEFREPNRAFAVGGQQGRYLCFRRDDRTNGITDQMTWAQVCFSGPEAQLQSANDFTYNMSFSGFEKFGGKMIAQNYVSRIWNDQHLSGKLKSLEAWTPDSGSLAIAKETPLTDRILTSFVPTSMEDAMQESAPKDVVWPAVRDGKTEGYMIVHAITDRAGQVREASEFSSDNPGVERYGRQIALQYKFKSLVVDNASQQMEMPLVIHFVTKIVNSIPELSDAETRRHITGCSPPHEIADPASAGQQIVITFQVNVDGKLSTVGSSDRKIPVMTLFRQFQACYFSPYEQNGNMTAYHANLTVTAR